MISAYEENVLMHAQSRITCEQKEGIKLIMYLYTITFVTIIE